MIKTALKINYGTLAPFNFAIISDKFDPSLWREFIKWFHCRPQSTCYTIRCKDSHLTVLRDRISSYVIYEETEE